MYHMSTSQRMRTRGGQMGFFRRFRRQPPQQQAIQPGGGMLEFFDLRDWWLRTFSPVERQYIEQRYQQSGGPSLTQGHIDSSSFSAPQFLAHLPTWLRPEDASITARIKAKVDELDNA